MFEENTHDLLSAFARRLQKGVPFCALAIDVELNLSYRKSLFLTVQSLRGTLYRRLSTQDEFDNVKVALLDGPDKGVGVVLGCIRLPDLKQFPREDGEAVKVVAELTRFCQVLLGCVLLSQTLYITLN